MIEEKFRPLRIKGLKEAIKDAPEDAMILIGVWNGYTDTYAVVDHIYTDWRYGDVQNDFYGTDGKMDNRLFFDEEGNPLAREYTMPICFIDTMFDHRVSHKEIDTDYVDPNTNILHINGEEGDHELFFKLNHFEKKGTYWIYTSTEEDSTDKYHSTKGKFVIRYYPITQKIDVVRYNDENKIENSYSGRCVGIRDFSRVMDACEINKTYWM